MRAWPSLGENGRDGSRGGGGGARAMPPERGRGGPASTSQRGKSGEASSSDPHHRHARSGADDGEANAARRPDLTIGTRAREQLEALLSQRRDRSSRARPDGRVVVDARAASAPEGEKDTDAARAATAKALATCLLYTSDAADE